MYAQDEIRPRASESTTLATFNPPLDIWIVWPKSTTGSPAYPTETGPFKVDGPRRALAVLVHTTLLSYRPEVTEDSITRHPAAGFEIMDPDVAWGPDGDSSTFYLVVGSYDGGTRWLPTRQVFFSEAEARKLAAERTTASQPKAGTP